MTRTTYKWLLFVRTAIRGIASSPVTSGISVVTIGVTLVLVGAFALLLRNMEELLDRFGDDLRVTAYLEYEISGEVLRALEDRVLAIPGVEDVGIETDARQGFIKLKRHHPRSNVDLERLSIGHSRAIVQGCGKSAQIQ